MPLRRPRQQLVTLRVVGFVGVLLVVLAAATVGVGLYRPGHVLRRPAHGDLTVYRGRPGGVLWFQPTVAETTTTPLTAVQPYQRATVTAGILEPSVAAADRYIRRVTAAVPT